MDSIVFRNIQDFVLQVEEFSTMVDEIVIIGDYQWTKYLLNLLIKNTAYILTGGEFHGAEFDGYNKEFIITLFDGEIWVEKYFVNDRYLDLIDGTDKVIMIGNGCSAEAYELNKEDSLDVYIEEDIRCEFCEDKDECLNFKPQDGEIPEDKQIVTHSCVDQSVDLNLQYPDGTEASINVYSDDSDLIKDIVQMYLCGANYD